MERGRLYGLDALRGIAAVVVSCYYHQFFILGVGRTGLLEGLPVFTWLHRFGWIAVDLFFVISGFVFCHVYFAERRMRSTFREFFGARAARLYPLHLLTLLVCAAIFSVSQPASGALVDLRHFVLNLFMLQTSGLEDWPSFNTPSWSISVELWCYAVFFLLARRTPRLLPYAAGVIVALALTTLMFYPSLNLWIARGFFGFFLGVLMWFGRSRPAPIAAALLLAASVFLWAGGIHVLPSVLVFTVWPTIVLLGHSWRPLAARPFQWLGERSYSIYLWNGPVFLGANALIFGGKPVPKEWWLITVGLAVFTLLMVAHFSFVYFEQPARRWLRRRLIPFKAPVDAPARLHYISAGLTTHTST